MTDAIAEFSVRLFYTADDCDLAPSVAICFPVANVGDVNWPSVLTELIEKAQGTVEGAPVENIRPMTQDETASYRAAERGE